MENKEYLKYIHNLLEENNRISILLEDCVLDITDKRALILSIYGDSVYIIKDFKICYADNHSDVLYNNNIETFDEIRNIILDIIKPLQ